jgi:predicted DCC family thiol-disulfide oxidoreductase YuxK
MRTVACMGYPDFKGQRRSASTIRIDKSVNAALPPAGRIGPGDAEMAQLCMIELYFDGACGLCVRTINRLRALDRTSDLTFLDSTNQENIARLNGATNMQPDVQRSMWALTPSGELYEGYHAFRVAFSTLRQLRWLGSAMSTPPLAAVGPSVYRFIASRRRSLGCKIKST